MLRDYVVRSLPENHGSSRQLSSSKSPLASIYNGYALLRLPYIACGAEKAAVPDRRTVDPRKDMTTDAGARAGSQYSGGATTKPDRRTKNRVTPDRNNLVGS